MPALDWAESKLDRSIISIGESCKTWFQEVWRLVFRVVVFVAAIVMGFLHKPGFEKWLAEQRNRFQPRNQPTDSSQSLSNGYDTTATYDSPRSHHPTSPLDPLSPNLHHDGAQASESSSSRFSKPLGRRKSGRLARTGFAELIHKSMTPDPTPTNSLLDPRPRHPSQRRPVDRILASQSQPSSYTDDALLDPELDDQQEPSEIDHRRRASRPSPILMPDSDEEDNHKSNGLRSTRPNAANEDEDGEAYDPHSAGYDDYDEYYGPKNSISEHLRLPEDIPPRKSRRKDHKRQPSVGSPSSHDHMFSMEGIDSATSPLLNMRTSSGNVHSATTTPRDRRPSGVARESSFGDISESQFQPSTDEEHYRHPWKDTTDLDEDGNAADLNSDNVSVTSAVSAPAFGIPVGPRRRLDFDSSEQVDTILQAKSVPADSALVSAGASRRRRRHQRARSMSPGGSSSSLYSASHVSRGGTGRRSTRTHPSHDEGAGQRYSTIDIHRDRIFTSDKLNTGAVEDLRMWILLFIDAVTSFFRRGVKRFFSFIRDFSLKNIFYGFFRSLVSWVTSPQAVLKSLFLLVWNLTFGLLIVLFYLPSRFLSGMKSSSFDKRLTSDIIKSQGYPYECYEVCTDDGYILRLERLARPKSNKIIYFQHGVVDNSFAWFGHVEGEAGSALAFRAYDQGYDVFVGTFRGCEGSTRHMRKDSDFTSSQYWNFSVNEHGMYDLKAFIDEIVKLKKKDLGPHFEPRNGAQTAPLSQNQFDIMLIAHSMGAMASLIYLVWSKIKERPHNISCAILLSPAGYHITAPIIVDIMGPLINLALWFFPWIHTLKFPGQTIRLLVSKILEDINNSFTGRTMMSWGVAKVIGGSIEDHPFVNLRNLTYNVFSGTSTGVFRHFWQIWRHKKFEGYDYGAAKNMQVYGTTKPIDFVENYHLYVHLKAF